MIKSKIENYVDNCFLKYESLLQEEAYFSCYVELGEIITINNKYPTNSIAKRKYLSQINLQLDNTEINNIVISVRAENYKHLQNIISIGDKFIEEEFFQILTLRFEVFLVNELLTLINIAPIALLEVDSSIKEIASKKQNFKAYLSVINKLKKTWGYVIVNSD